MNEAGGKSLNDIGEAIGLVFQLARAGVMASGLSIEDLDRFEAYIRQQDAYMPVVNATYWTERGRRELPEVLKRTQVLRSVLELVATHE